MLQAKTFNDHLMIGLLGYVMVFLRQTIFFSLSWLRPSHSMFFRHSNSLFNRALVIDLFGFKLDFFVLVATWH